MTVSPAMLVSLRDNEGAHHSLPGLISMEFDYTFSPQMLNETYERQITRCVHMDQLANITSAQFNKTGCQTVFFYEQGKVECKCEHMSFYTIARDEFEIPLIDDMSFNFKNWASLSVFSYLILLLITGLILSHNAD